MVEAGSPDGTKKTKILIAIPTLGSINFRFVHSLAEFMVDCTRMESEGYEFLMMMLPKMLVAQAREEAAKQCIALKCDYLFMVDDDMVLPRFLMKRLLDAKKDIVSVMSWERLGDHHPNLYNLLAFDKDEKGGVVYGSWKWRNITTEELDEWRKQKKDIVSIDVTGFGCVLIKTEALKKIKEPWFMSQFQCGEDFFFCFKAKDAGLGVHAIIDEGMSLGHIGEPIVITEFLHRYNMHIKKEQEAACPK